MLRCTVRKSGGCVQLTDELYPTAGAAPRDWHSFESTLRGQIKKSTIAPGERAPAGEPHSAGKQRGHRRQTKTALLRRVVLRRRWRQCWRAAGQCLLDQRGWPRDGRAVLPVDRCPTPTPPHTSRATHTSTQVSKTRHTAAPPSLAHSCSQSPLCRLPSSRTPGEGGHGQLTYSLCGHLLFLPPLPPLPPPATPHRLTLPGTCPSPPRHRPPTYATACCCSLCRHHRLPPPDPARPATTCPRLPCRCLHFEQRRDGAKHIGAASGHGMFRGCGMALRWRSLAWPRARCHGGVRSSGQRPRVVKPQGSLARCLRHVRSTGTRG